jgi:ligand-binding sensor domain-containing protein
MKQIYSLLLLLIFIYGNKASGQITMSELDALVKAGIDPYFVKSKDTISTRGPNCIVRNLLQDKTGNIWLATWQGIMRYDGKVFTNYTLKNDLIKFHVFSLFEDSKGNLWFGTARGGLYRYNGKSFTLFTTKDGLADNTVSCMTEDKEGNIWFGTENGASRYDGKTFTNFTTQNGLSGNNINSIIQDKTGKLWFSGDGVTCYDGKSFTKFTDKNGQPFQQVASLLEDKDGKIWIGTGKGKGLCYYDGKSLSDYLVPNFVMYMCEDKKGNLWLSYNTYPVNPKFVLYRYDGKSFAKIMEEPYSGAIFGIIEDKNGNIWFGTGLGVCRFDVLQADNPCVKRTCKHDQPLQEATKEHNKELAKSYTYFRE